MNDSLHPALLLAPVLGFPFPVVQLYGENLWRAMEDNFDHRAPAWVGERYRQSLRWVRDRAFARIVHTLGEDPPPAREVHGTGPLRRPAAPGAPGRSTPTYPERAAWHGDC